MKNKTQWIVMLLGMGLALLIVHHATAQDKPEFSQPYKVFTVRVTLRVPDKVAMLKLCQSLLTSSKGKVTTKEAKALIAQYGEDLCIQRNLHAALDFAYLKSRGIEAKEDRIDRNETVAEVLK